MSTCWMCLSWSRWVLCAKQSKYIILLDIPISKPPALGPGSRNACRSCQASRGLYQLWLCEAVQFGLSRAGRKLKLVWFNTALNGREDQTSLMLTALNGREAADRVRACMLFPWTDVMNMLLQHRPWHQSRQLLPGQCCAGQMCADLPYALVSAPAEASL